MENIIPKDKFDIEAIERLQHYSFEEIKEQAPKLLEWLQDCNWPVASPVFNYFTKYVNSIDDHILKILEGEDGMWKYWIIRLISNSEKQPNEKIVKALTNLVANPTKDDIDCEVDAEAKKLLAELMNGRM